MKLLVFSDSHGRGKNILEAVDLHGGVADAIIFLGDGLSDLEAVKRKYDKIPVFSVKGNCDFYDFNDTPEEILVNFDGIKILLCHGHKYGVKSSLTRILYRCLELEADAVFFGHTHVPVEMTEYVAEKRIQIFNPGSIGSYSYGVVNTSGKVLVMSHGSL
jgi:putative phosphoesterase